MNEFFNKISVVVGNINSGKSTFTNNFRKQIPNSFEWPVDLHFSFGINLLVDDFEVEVLRDNIKCLDPLSISKKWSSIMEWFYGGDDRSVIVTTCSPTVLNLFQRSLIDCIDDSDWWNYIYFMENFKPNKLTDYLDPEYLVHSYPGTLYVRGDFHI